VKRLMSCLAVAAGMALLSPSLARADKIDQKLTDEMPKVVKYLKDHGYKNVGVLRFRAQKANDKHAHFDMGEINGNMADRLENALVMNAGQAKNPEAPAFGVIHDAGAVAGKGKVGSWFNHPEERKKLFGLSYPLAWGKESVKPDAFLTGKVSLAEDLAHTAVRIECFDAKSDKIAEVLKFSVPTDRHIVRDCNLPYTLTKAQHQTLARSARSAKSRDQQQQVQQKTDQVVLQQAQQQQKQPNKPQQPPGTQDGPAVPQQVGGIKLKITAGDADVALRPNSSQVGTFEMDCPARDSVVVFHLENTSPDELGVVLKVAGMATLGQQKDQAENCRKWLVPAGKTYQIKGFYVGEGFKSLKKFSVKTKEEAKQTNQQLDDSIDLIEMYVFKSIKPDQPPEKGEPMTISDRGVNSRGIRGDREPKARSAFPLLKNALLRECRLKKSRGRDGAEVIVADDTEVPAGEITEKEFPNPVEVKNLKIRIRPAGAPQPVEQPPAETADKPNN